MAWKLLKAVLKRKEVVDLLTQRTAFRASIRSKSRALSSVIRSNPLSVID